MKTAKLSKIALNDQNLSARKAKNVKGGLLTSLQQMQHDTAKGIIQNIRA